MDYFGFFDLPRNLAIDLKDLEKRFYALSRKYHPDVHARKAAAEREQAEESTALLNDAYRTLRDPIARTAYLLKLEGFDIGEQTTKDVPPELLEEIFELNMELEEGEAGAGTPARFIEMRDEVDTEIKGKFDEWDLGGKRETLAELRGLLNRRKYISNLIDKTNVPDRV
jgi:molecular chaperone HscB